MAEWRRRASGNTISQSSRKTPGTGAPLSKRDTEALRELRETLTMEKCRFGNIHPAKDDPLPKSESEVDEFIKRRTRLWLETWVFPTLDEIVARRSDT